MRFASLLLSTLLFSWGSQSAFAVSCAEMVDKHSSTEEIYLKKMFKIDEEFIYVQNHRSCEGYDNVKLKYMAYRRDIDVELEEIRGIMPSCDEYQWWDLKEVDNRLVDLDFSVQITQNLIEDEKDKIKCSGSM